MERTFNSDDLSWIAFSLIEYSRSMDYEGDLSDCGNEIGNMVGSKYKNMTEGEIEDARHSIFEGMNRLSTIARKNQLFDEILDVDDAFPLDSTEWMDTDGDGVGDGAATAAS